MDKGDFQFHMEANVKNFIFIICMAFLLTACGGSSSDSKTSTTNTADNNETATKIGVFIDAPVKGLSYASSPSGKKGITNEKGEFEYIDGDIVSFNMGSIELGKATPDKSNRVKVTQLDQALLVAQLLQVLDNDVNEDRIDVSDIVIPGAVKEVIVDKLKDENGDATTTDIITEDQLVSIKKVNPKKLTLQQRDKVVTKEKALAHVKRQTGKSGLRFSISELTNQLFFSTNLLTQYTGGILAFPSGMSNPVNRIEVYEGQADPLLQSWTVDNQGNLILELEINISDQGQTVNITCTLSKIAEEYNAIDVYLSCPVLLSTEVNKSIFVLNKPQPFSANDISGKSFNLTTLSGEKINLTFRNDGSLNCNDDKSPCNYKDHPSYKNTIWIEGGGDNGEKNKLMILAQGTLAKGKFVIIHYKDDGNTLDSVEVMNVSGDTLKQVFKSAENNESGDHNNNTDDNFDSSDNPNAGTENPTYIPFTQEMLSDKTFYYVSNEDDDEGTIFFGANKKGQVWLSLSYSNTLPDVTFDYLIDNEGYIIISNTKGKGVVSGDTPAIIGLLSKTNNAFTTCWGSDSVSDISDYCKDDDIDVWYKTKEDAEAALKQHKNNDRDEDTDDNSDSIDNPNAGTQNPTYTPFTQEMISGKTFYALATYFDPKNIPIYLTTTIQFDPLNGKNTAPGRSQYIYDENLSDIDTTFEYGFLDGFLIFSNRVQSGSEPETITHKLLDKTDQFLKVCSTFTEIRKEDNDGCTIELWYYNKKDAEEASKE